VVRHLHALALVASVPRNVRGRTVCVSTTLPACACCVSRIAVSLLLVDELVRLLCRARIARWNASATWWVYQCRRGNAWPFADLVHERWKLLELSKRLSAEYISVSRENDASFDMVNGKADRRHDNFLIT